MLPFLKRRQEGAATGEVESIERKPDEPQDYDMLDAIAEDVMTALEQKDIGLLKEALASLCDHILDMDQEQDEQE